MQEGRTLRRAAAVLVASLVLGVVPEAGANRNGAPGGFNGSPASGGSSCSVCHDELAGAGSVEIIGAPTEYLPNVVYDLIVRISDPDQVGAGFELSAEDIGGTHRGTLIISDAVNTQFTTTAGWVTHSEDGVDNSVASWAAMGDTADFAMQWQAPATDEGAITFYAVGNAIDDSNNFFGDLIYLDQVTATAGSDCPEDLTGPNPGDPPDGTINVFDLLLLLGNFGNTPPADTTGDITGANPGDPPDGVVNVFDLLQLLAVFGDTCPTQ